jgi:hypothetical protein
VSKFLSGFDGHRISDSASGNRAASSISQFRYWPSSSHGGSGRLENAAHLQQFQGESVLQEIGGGADAGQQQLRAKAGDERAVAAPNVENAGCDQRSHRLSHGVATRAEQFCQFSLGW